jgi:hypothetical protein
MPYVEDIAEPLIKTLAHTAGLPVNQLAGHASNIGFWADEVAHALHVIDGYSDRFKSMQLGQRTYAEGNLVFSYHTKPLRPGIQDHELIDLRRSLTEAFSRFLTRCFKESLIIETELDFLIGRFKLDPRSVKLG